MDSRGGRRSLTTRREPAYAPPPAHGVHTTAFSRLLAQTNRSIPGHDQPGFFDPHGRSLQVHCSGDRTLIRSPCVAVVGTREPSTMGAARARRLARELVRAGVVIVSGLARGIDTAALTAAMDAGGRVIGVLGTPLDKAYPAENKRLQERIYHEHLLVSQFPRGQRVHQSNFPVRNRLMAAMTDATVIVEAGETSGTLHQAAECVRLGRWLFIARSIVDDPLLAWPASFLVKPRVRVLTSSADVLAVLSNGS